MKIWGIHMDEKVGSSPLVNNYVGIGWPELGNLKPIASSREQLKQELLNTYPDIDSTISRCSSSLFAILLAKFNESIISDFLTNPNNLNIFRIIPEGLYVNKIYLLFLRHSQGGVCSASGNDHNPRPNDFASFSN